MMPLLRREFTFSKLVLSQDDVCGIGASTCQPGCLEPAVPADVRWTVVLLPNSDPAQAITHTVVGVANPYGYFAAPDVFIWTEPGEYRVDVEATYMAPNEELYKGAMRWGSVVATPNSPLEAHGRRGLDGLGYIAPASLWAEKNHGPVWISTFTRNLQRQLDSELNRLYPDPGEKRRKVVVRKGRENYLC